MEANFQSNNTVKVQAKENEHKLKNEQRSAKTRIDTVANLMTCSS